MPELFTTWIYVCSTCIMERGGWTTNLAELRQWLDGVQLTGGGRSETALAEAFAEAIYMFNCPSTLGDVNGISNQLLVATVSEPCRATVRWPFAKHCNPKASLCLLFIYEACILHSCNIHCRALHCAQARRMVKHLSNSW